jgi:hypothetical protein
MGVPIEWNVIMVYGGFVLFGAHAATSALSVGSPILIVFLVCALFLWQVWGNLAPSQVSFLPSMRYYAGNWAYSVWLFRGEASQRLDEKLVKAAPHVREQLRRFYADDVVTAALSKVIAFRAMHLHGRALEELIPRAVPNVDDYEYLDGEIVAGLALGWNFGDGHLHDEQLLAAIQARCGFAEGELRCIFVESQPIFRPRHAWRIVDAKTGEIARGEVSVDTLLARQPWPTA